MKNITFFYLKINLLLKIIISKIFDRNSKCIYIILFIYFLLNNKTIYYFHNIKQKNKYHIFNNITKNISKKLNIYLFNKYIKSCKQLKRSENIKNNKNEYPFLSVCICVYNSEKYIKKAILSIINQTYQNFEIIIINDFSNDNSYDIITELKMLDNRIKIINHINNLGIYHSRVEGVLNSRGKYIIFLDPDDLFLNPYLFELLFNCYKFYNLDIIEFTAYYKIEEKNKIYYSENELLNHEHNFEKIFIYQPELSNILFYKPRTKNYSMIICRTVWSKLYKKDIILKTINFIGIDYYENHNIIVAEDTLLNIISFHFANNYSNINIPGYLYNIRQFSITRLNQTREYKIKKCISFFLYYNCLYRYIKEFNKDRNYFYYELEVFGFEIIKLKKYNIKKYLYNATSMFKEIINDNKITFIFKHFIKTKYKLLLK